MLENQIKMQINLSMYKANSRQHCDNYLTHPTNSSKPHPLLAHHSSFTPNLIRHCPSTNLIRICPLLPTSPSQLQTTSTIAVWLSAWLTLWIWLAVYQLCFGQAPVNKLVPATSLLWAL